MSKDRVTLSKQTPHKSAALYRASRDPTLIRVAEDWLTYHKSGAYVLIENGTMQADISKFLVAAQVAVFDPKTQKMDAAPFNPKSADVMEVYNALTRLCHRELVSFKPPCWLDGRDGPDPRNIIACRNGLLDVTTLILHPHTSDFFTRSALPIDYESFPRQPEGFLKFLSEAMMGRQSLIDLIQEMTGYLIASDAEMEAVFYLLGKSRGGKGTLLKIIAALIGDRNLAAPTIRSFAERFWAWPLMDKTVAFITDMAINDREAVKLAANHINMVSGRDPIMIDRKNKELIAAYTLPTRIVIVGNSMPDFGDHATALANRLLAIPFDVSFKDREDRGLARRLIADELPGILAWALEGLARLRERGNFVEPEASLAVKRDLTRLANPILSFLDEMCLVETGASVPKEALYRHYRDWCDAAGIKGVLALKDFAQRLYEAVSGSREFRPRAASKQVPHFAGLRMRPHARGPMPAAKPDFEAVLNSELDLGTPPNEAIEHARRARALN